MKIEACTYFQAFIRLLFPPLCVVCGRALVRGERYLCSVCLADFPLADRSYQSDESLLTTFEEACRPQTVYALFYYNKCSDYRNLIYAVKYRSRKELGVYLGRMLGEKIGKHSGVDGIVPIPLHPRRERERGYNQARQIALGMAEAMGIPVWDRVVIRIRNNTSQTGKNAGERQKNVEDIFELTERERIRGKHIMVVDDVITTGATIRSCIRTLAEAEVAVFSLGCLARTEL